MRANRVLAASLMAGGLLAAAMAGPASAAQDTAGTPGEKNCVGQTMAYIAQGGTAPGLTGIGNVAAESGLSNQTIKALAAWYCGD